METRASSPSASALMDQLRKALEAQDFDALANLFAEDATLEEVSSLNPPAHPLVIRGRDAIRKHLRDEAQRDPIAGWKRKIQKSAVLDGLETDEALAFTEERIYAAGDKAVSQHVARKSGGAIVHDRVVVAWDPD